MSLLEIETLVKQFAVRGSDRPLVAVGGISLELDAGETLALVGESGSGKTTVGRIVVGLERATSGSVRFDGREVGGLAPRARRELAREIQIVFQDPGDSLDPRLPVARLVAEPLTPLKLEREELRRRVDAAFERVRLPGEIGRRYPHELSSGRQQQVALARALVVEPRLVVLDEPTSALDVRARAELLSIIEELRTNDGLASLFISHDLTAVHGIANRVAVMYLGEIVELAQTDALFDSPRHPYTQALLSAVPEPDLAQRGRERIRLTGEIPSPIDLPVGCYLQGRCPRVQEVCRTVHPPLAPAPDGRLVGCLFEQRDAPIDFAGAAQAAPAANDQEGPRP